MTKLTQAQFVTRYGRQSLRVLRMLVDGFNTQYIAKTMKMSRKSVAAFAANFTRGVYRQWVSSFGWTPRYSQATREVITDLRSGLTTDQIAHRHSLDPRSVAAFKANFTRGAYDNVASITT